MAADDIAKGALRLIRWGKDVVPATVDEIADLGPNAARVKALLRFIPTLGGDAGLIARDADRAVNLQKNLVKEFASTMEGRRGEQAFRAQNKALEQAVNTIFDKGLNNGKAFAQDSVPRFFPAWDATTRATTGESISDLASPELYRGLTSPFNAGRRFAMTVPNAPEGFTSIARTLGEMGQITGPKSIEAARRLSMESPTLTQIVTTFVQDGMSLEDALAAARALGL